MTWLQVRPDRSTYRPGEPVCLEVAAPGCSGATVQGTITHLGTKLTELVGQLDHNGSATLRWEAPMETPRGYGVDIKATQTDIEGPTGSTAFDVLAHWTERPRYGFLTDFTKQRAVEEALETLVSFHINVLQFYDWQYRHDQLVSPTVDYIDPLGRTLSLETVRHLIKQARIRGIASMAYAAVYAASLGYQMEHRDWALFDRERQPHVFEGFLGYMDPSPNRPWAAHLLGECSRALDELGFDGIHLDQYGEPRTAFDANGAEVDLPAAFSAFVADLKRRRPRAAVTMNAVRNWPLEQLATSDEDFYYVEVWPDTPTYRDLRRIVRDARRLSPGKPVVVAAYIPGDQEANVRLADAVVLSAGGTRIELGEKQRLLTDPYFPNHQPLAEKMEPTLRTYWDVTVRYGDILFAPESTELLADAPTEVWSVPRHNEGWLGLSLVNQHGLDNARWDQPHPPPMPFEDFEVRIRARRAIARALWVDPDSLDAKGHPVVWYPSPGGGSVRIPRLECWGLLLLEIEEGE